MQTEIVVNAKAYEINEVQLFGGGPFDVESITLVRRQQLDGSTKWAVMKRTMWCLSKDAEWEIEPMPSSRDDAYLERCRFDTPDEALAVWRGMGQ